MESKIIQLFLCSIVVGIGSGILIDYYSLLKEEFQSIMKKDYVVFAGYIGLNKWKFALKEILFNFVLRLYISLNKESSDGRQME